MERVLDLRPLHTEELFAHCVAEPVSGAQSHVQYDAEVGDSYPRTVGVGRDGDLLGGKSDLFGQGGAQCSLDKQIVGARSRLDLPP